MNEEKDKEQVAMEESFNNIFEGILGGVRKETREKYPTQIELLQHLLEDPDNYNLFVMYPLGNMLEEALRVKFPNLAHDNVHKVSFLYENLTYIKQSFEDIIIKFNRTSACCADQSSFIMNQIKRHYTEGKEFDFSPYHDKRTNADYDYHIPKFWDKNGGAEWLELYDALISFAYGHNKKYIEFYAKTIIPLLTTQKNGNEGNQPGDKEVSPEEKADSGDGASIEGAEVR